MPGSAPMSHLVLIVDDCPVMRDLIAQVLRAAGHRVETAADGGEALLRLTALSPDLVLLDLHMPGLEGLGVLRAIKAHEPTRAVPVMMLTAEADDARLIEAHRAGAVGYLHKPFRPERLTAQVADVLAGQGLRWIDDEHRMTAAA